MVLSKKKEWRKKKREKSACSSSKKKDAKSEKKSAEFCLKPVFLFITKKHNEKSEQVNWNEMNWDMKITYVYVCHCQVFFILSALGITSCN